VKNYLIVLFCLLLSTPLQAQDRITLLLDWFINPDHEPIIIAQEKRSFVDAGLEVEVIAPADPADPPKMVAAADLKGKKVGFSIAGVEEALLTTILARNGLSMTDIELVNVNWSLSPSVMSGQVDAVIGAFRNFELNQMDI